MNRTELEKAGIDELRFEHYGWDCMLWFNEDDNGWVVEELRKAVHYRVGVIPLADFPDVIYGNPEDWLIETAKKIIG